MHAKHVRFLCLFWCIAIMIGCEPKLETGYTPRPLNATEADRRAYYAPAFTPESHPPKDSGGPGFEGLH